MDYGKSLCSVQPSGTNCCEVYSVAYKEKTIQGGRDGEVFADAIFTEKNEKGDEKKKKERKRKKGKIELKRVRYLY